MNDYEWYETYEKLKRRKAREWAEYQQQRYARRPNVLSDSTVDAALAEGKWASADGRVSVVVDMETDHLINVVTFLLRAELRQKQGLEDPKTSRFPAHKYRPIFAAMVRELNARLARKRAERRLQEKA